METKNKLKIILSIKGIEADFGPITCCLIGVDANSIHNDPISLLIENKSDKIFEDNILKEHYINKIEAKDIDGTKKQISMLVFNAINTVRNFWEHDIHILSKDIRLSDLDNKTSLAKNIKKAKVYIGENFFNKQLKKLSEYVHSCYYDTEYRLLKLTYGDEKCIHTRKEIKEEN